MSLACWIPVKSGMACWHTTQYNLAHFDGQCCLLAASERLCNGYTDVCAARQCNLLLQHLVPAQTTHTWSMFPLLYCDVKAQLLSSVVGAKHLNSCTGRMRSTCKNETHRQASGTTKHKISCISGRLCSQAAACKSIAAESKDTGQGHAS